MTESTTKRKDGSKRRTSAMRQLSSRQRMLYTIAAIALLVAAIALSAGSEGGTGWLGLGDGDEVSSSEATASAESSGTARASTEESGAASAGDLTGDDDDGESGGADSSTGETTDPDPDVDADDDISRTAVSQIDIPDFELPQTYEADVVVVGWASSSAGTVYLEVRDATLLGPIDHMTGDEIEPADPAQDLSARFEELTILATTSEGVRRALETSDPVRVRLVLIPSGDGAVFRVDRLAD